MTEIRLYVTLPGFQCDPTVDADILRLAAMSREAQSSGINFFIHTLQNEPAVFLYDPLISDRLMDLGDDALPIVVVDGKVVLEGRYPEQAEVEEWLDFKFAPISVEKEAALQRAMAEELAMGRAVDCGGCLSGSCADCIGGCGF